MVYLPKARNDWWSLKFQNFKSVQQYNAELFKIVSVLSFCDWGKGAESHNPATAKTYIYLHSPQVIWSLLFDK